ncbi:MAG: hypothetical protein A2081_03820 [Elusimicrobia bacterium GWC2_61_19]|nr:MAG: hypothetical protein A2081_03820 [Elusimicrobia bacterium GWC2_61_19]
MNKKMILASLLFAAAPCAASASVSFSDFDGPGFLVVNPRVKTKLKQEAFQDVIAAADVIYAGDERAGRKDHLAQLELIRTLTAVRKGRVTVALAALNAASQPALDDYLAARTTEAVFLKEAGWDAQTGVDFRLYRPLLEFIRENKLRAAAIGIPRPVISKIARGGLAALDKREKALFPADMPAETDKAYLAYVRTAYKALAPGISWPNYLTAMSAWNSGLGANALRLLKTAPGGALLILAGNSHIKYNAGLAAYVRSRAKGLAHCSIATEDAAKLEDFMKDPAPLADYVRFISR